MTWPRCRASFFRAVLRPYPPPPTAGPQFTTPDGGVVRLDEPRVPGDRRVDSVLRASFERIADEVDLTSPASWSREDVDDLVRRMIGGGGPLRPPS